MLSTMLKPTGVFTGVELGSYDKTTAIEEITGLSSLAKSQGRQALREAFLAREAMDSTGCGYGIAIPHAKLKDLTKPEVMVVQFSQAIDWEAIDDQPVKVAIALIMPDQDEENTHLQVISKFARKLIHEDFVQKLTSTDDKTELYQFIINEMED